MKRPGRLPNFLVIGAMKSGSTSLYNHLRDQPQVFMTSYKEPEFFVAEKTWSRGIGWYRSLFSEAGQARAVGEASTSYTKFTEFAGVPERIHSILPDVRLIYILRHPLARIESMYNHMVLTGQENRLIDEAVLTDKRYLGPSLYAQNIRGYLDYFPRVQLHIMLTDELEQDPLQALKGVTAFLEIPDPRSVRVARVDLRTSDRRTDRRLKTWLRDVPSAHLMLQRLPESVQARLRTATSRQSPTRRPTLSKPTEAELLERLGPDLAELRAILGAGFDGWGLLPR